MNVSRIGYLSFLAALLAGAAGAEEASATTAAWLGRQSAVREEVCRAYAIDWKMMRNFRIGSQQLSIAKADQDGEPCYYIVSVERDAMEKTKETRTDVFLSPDLRVLAGATIAMQDGEERSSLKVTVVDGVYQLHAKGVDYGPHPERTPGSWPCRGSSQLPHGRLIWAS